ncbi:S-methyl-5-thioribose-1-phosphate isomerase [Jimgerdemannia flammicorona]|uniref:Methylthioribose-1-phosphate isomerase n=1 Tax=Jimgerdemannia flammicorona TaxID=994334 RepID=A0A433QQ51_9FUNG|nr:S-methyl-5-thioribose-1-phosphate isomerase [Jimgerdemannia flammicorona]
MRKNVPLLELKYRPPTHLNTSPRTMSARTLEAIRYTPDHLQVLNQLVLPHETLFERVETIQDGHATIKTMKVRGAPAIAIVAALALAVDLSARHKKGEFPNAAAAVAFVSESLQYLKTSRPTAVNLFDAANKLLALVQERGKTATGAQEVVDAYVAAAEKMLVDDVQDNKNIGRFGAEYIFGQAKNKDNVRVLTHCNTGSLATAGWGTALGIIRDLHATGHLSHAYCTETRPYNQGSRLTAYELVYEGIPATLVTDSMASALLRSQPVAAVIVGADRVARNGDTANKIGTYQLAIVARHHGVAFVVAAPSTSVDLSIASGAEIPIEERAENEVVTVRGIVVPLPGEEAVREGEARTVQIAAKGISVWNPSFDVTPASLISAIVTERGVVLKKEGEDVFDMAAFLGK